MNSFIQILSAVPCFTVFQLIYSLIFLKLKLLNTSIILIMVLFLVLKLTNLTAFSKYISSVYSYAAIRKHSQRYKFILENPLHNTSRTKFSIMLGFLIYFKIFCQYIKAFQFIFIKWSIDRLIDSGTVRFEFGTYSTVQVIVFLKKISIMTSHRVINTSAQYHLAPLDIALANSIFLGCFFQLSLCVKPACVASLVLYSLLPMSCQVSPHFS